MAACCDKYALIVMPYYPQGDLVLDGKQDPSRVHRLMSQVALAVEYLHQNNVAHNDIKLDNVFVDASDRAYLGDMGLALKVKDETRTAPAWRVGGTKDYWAPEIREAGEEDYIDPFKCDVFAIGIMYWALVTGQDFQAGTKFLVRLQVASVNLSAVQRYYVLGIGNWARFPGRDKIPCKIAGCFCESLCGTEGQTGDEMIRSILIHLWLKMVPGARSRSACDKWSQITSHQRSTEPASFKVYPEGSPMPQALLSLASSVLSVKAPPYPAVDKQPSGVFSMTAALAHFCCSCVRRYVYVWIGCHLLFGRSKHRHYVRSISI
ncbi:hypothetical protein EGW08_000773 [Elysia chlorotica]|uniref:Protein kinase domain-containing protein n=1 Tax=Elysia chlorotica TaxID=188477 RepID=A0A433UCC5_ELYCH|nr:hypothetical protein EGW08_000773 [Elysia chlorotica]